MNKYKLVGIPAGISAFLIISGLWAKITHQPYADAVLTIGMWMFGACAGVLVYFIFTSHKPGK